MTRFREVELFQSNFKHRIDNLKEFWVDLSKGATLLLWLREMFLSAAETSVKILSK